MHHPFRHPAVQPSSQDSLAHGMLASPTGHLPLNPLRMRSRTYAPPHRVCSASACSVHTALASIQDILQNPTHPCPRKKEFSTHKSPETGPCICTGMKPVSTCSRTHSMIDCWHSLCHRALAPFGRMFYRQDTRLRFMGKLMRCSRLGAAINAPRDRDA